MSTKVNITDEGKIEGYLTIREAAEKYGIEYKKFRNDFYNNFKFKYLKIYGMILVDEKDMATYMSLPKTKTSVVERRKDLVSRIKAGNFDIVKYATDYNISLSTARYDIYLERIRNPQIENKKSNAGCYYWEEVER